MEHKNDNDSVSNQTLVGVDNVLEHAFDVFGSDDKVQLWLNTPNGALNHSKPVDLLNVPEGLTRVYDILGRIEHGIHS